MRHILPVTGEGVGRLIFPSPNLVTHSVVLAARRGRREGGPVRACMGALSTRRGRPGRPLDAIHSPMGMARPSFSLTRWGRSRRSLPRARGFVSWLGTSPCPSPLARRLQQATLRLDRYTSLIARSGHPQMHVVGQQDGVEDILPLRQLRDRQALRPTVVLLRDEAARGARAQGDLMQKAIAVEQVMGNTAAARKAPPGAHRVAFVCAAAVDHRRSGRKRCFGQARPDRRSGANR